MATTEARAVVRGSSELSEEMFGKPNTVSKESLRQLIKVTRMKGSKLDSWWIRGQPAIDGIIGSIRAEPRVAGDIIKEMLAIDGLRLKLEGFPIGIPNPEFIQVNFETPGMG